LWIEFPEKRAAISRIVEDGLARAPRDIGVRWESGRFYPSGDPLLDRRFVVEPLRWLRERRLDGVYEPFDSALRGLIEAQGSADRLKGVVRDCYESVEHLAKVATGADRDLTANLELLISKLKLPRDIASLLKGWIAFGNPYRHGRPLAGLAAVSPERAEEFVYETGLILRAMVLRMPDSEGRRPEGPQSSA
jgi:hypothetical protein